VPLGCFTPHRTDSVPSLLGQPPNKTCVYFPGRRARRSCKQENDPAGGSGVRLCRQASVPRALRGCPAPRSALGPSPRRGLGRGHPPGPRWRAGAVVACHLVSASRSARVREPASGPWRGSGAGRSTNPAESEGAACPRAAAGCGVSAGRGCVWGSCCPGAAWAPWPGAPQQTAPLQRGERSALSIFINCSGLVCLTSSMSVFTDPEITKLNTSRWVSQLVRD